jgi:hypothetical protein
MDVENTARDRVSAADLPGRKHVMIEQPRTAPSVIDWPDTVRAVLSPLVRGAREVWRGLDTWGAITQGVVPLSGAQQEQLAVRGDVDALTALANAGDDYAAVLLARMPAVGSAR